MIRLQKFIADCGVTSRRKAEDLIVAGKVLVNGAIVRELGTKVDPNADIVEVNGQSLDYQRVDKHYIVLHKPRCYMTTLNDPEGRKTVLDLVKEIPERIYPVGRLDYLSEGLLLMTNDGDMANLIIHPSTNITKVYEVKVFGAITEALLKKLRNGVETTEGFLKPKSVRIIKQLPTKTWLEFRLTEGKNREIRRICEAVGVTIDKLKRIAIGGLTVEGIAPGNWRYLSKRQLLDAIGINEDGSLSQEIEYWSPKKTIDLKRKAPQAVSAADDKGFHKFRKDVYFQSIKEIGEKKKRIAEQEKTEFYAQKEEAHQKRKLKKEKREKNKLESQDTFHAEFVK